MVRALLTLGTFLVLWAYALTIGLAFYFFYWLVLAYLRARVTWATYGNENGSADADDVLGKGTRWEGVLPDEPIGIIRVDLSRRDDWN